MDSGLRDGSRRRIPRRAQMRIVIASSPAPRLLIPSNAMTGEARADLQGTGLYRAGTSSLIEGALIAAWAPPPPVEWLATDAATLIIIRAMI